MRNKLSYWYWKYFWIVYRLYIVYLAYKVRKKDTIRVIFVISELASWKTEELFVQMFLHPRFHPIIGISKTIEVNDTEENLVGYLQKKDYPFINLIRNPNGLKDFQPDLIFYYKPYISSVGEQLCYRRNLGSLICSINYAFNTILNPKHINHPIFHYSWYVFVENESVANSFKAMIGRVKGHNVVPTGVPLFDIYKGHLHFDDPWRDQSKRKRIIYAPHHSIKGTNAGGIEYATFLEYSEFMLNMAKKYKNDVYFSFKPHPNLYNKLIKIWGVEKTSHYYNEWYSLENSQIDTGDYYGLFQYSDAMIHDCASFTVEYHMTKKPVMYLISERHQKDKLNELGNNAYNVHYKGRTKSDIENFIKMIIRGEDPLSKERLHFYDSWLSLPDGKTASERIINTILNKN